MDNQTAETAGATMSALAVKDDYEQTLKGLQQEHGPILPVKTPAGNLFFKMLTTEACDRWYDRVTSDNANRPAVTRECAMSALVHPSREEAIAVFKTMGALPASIVKSLRVAGGLSAHVEIMKQEGAEDVAVVETDYGTLKFRAPTQGDHERWMQQVSDGKGSKARRTREYVLSALVFPSKTEAEEIFGKLAALQLPVSDALAEMAGSEIELEVKKA